MHRRTLIATLAFIVMAGLWLVPQPAEAASRPSISSLSRTTAAVAGGTTITIHGKRLHLVKAVYFGGAKTTKIKHVSRTTIVVTAPRHAVGTVRVWLRTKTREFRTTRSVRYKAPATTPNSYEAEVLRLTNSARTHGYTCRGKAMPAVPALTWNGKLGYAARAHSRDMAKRDYFSHTSKDGTDFAKRVTQTGYRWSALGENIAAGQTSPTQVVNAWLSSKEGHCENIMSASYTQLGVGYVTGGSYGTYWTQDFGRP